ncbi:MAG: TetR/AcrR family transcriptional regulator [Microbacterium sp.]|uniref:AcrR family transcriptional regulator n=1 Tax=Microbacterium natoriense TaxID=284570 RepID=A0AAW8F2Z3_9MICO|nr:MULTISPECIES: TetR/AcrR family transcriptional regulator [Microbacterium]MBW8762814.1 TetR/AcrR family transcriptional regulator [Microbacterium sp.]MDQ0649587.1 AcrR family transcriptional regulator [Microbacterium natoriense]
MASDKAATRVRLDRAMIIDAGMELAETGVASISVRDLGARLGADPTAIYRHFASKDALMSALLDELNGRAAASVGIPAEDWAGRLRALGEATLAAFMRYPAIGAEATTLTTHGPGELAAIELMLDALHRAGLRGQDLVRHYALLASHVLSVAAGIARARAGREVDTDDSPWIDAPLLADPRQFPLIAEHSVLLSDLKDREQFLLGIDVIIDAAARAAANA